MKSFGTKYVISDIKNLGKYDLYAIPAILQFQWIKMKSLLTYLAYLALITSLMMSMKILTNMAH